MKTLPIRSLLLALALAAFALPSFAAPTATKISSRRNCILYRDGTATSWASGNWVGINGNSHADELFDGDFENYINQNSAGAYLVMDLTPICVEEDGQPFVTDILIGHAGNAQYSLYYTTEAAPAAGSTSDDRTWNPVVVKTQAGGTKTYGVNAIATAVKYVWDTSLGWGGASLAEIEVQGYEYVPPKAVKISDRRNCILYRDGTATSWASGNWIGINGNSHADELFDGNFTNYVNQNSSGAYLVLDTTMRDNGVSTGNGYFVTDVLIGHAGNTQYSLYYTTEAAPAAGATSDDRTWNPVVVKTQAGGTKTYGVNAIATAVKYVWDTSLGWGGASLAEIEIWGMDPADITCLHPHVTDESPAWVVVSNSATCTQFGYMMRKCPDCGEEFDKEDPNQLPAHDYVATLVRPGTATAYGEGYFLCSRCGDRVTFTHPADLVTDFSCGMLVPGQVLFTSVTVSSVWHSDWGVVDANIIDGSFDFDYHCWASDGIEGEHCDFMFGAPLEITAVDIATHNHNHTLQFYSVDDATGEETLVAERVVVKQDSGEAQRFTIPFYDTVSKHLRLRTTADEGYHIWGGNSIGIAELHPYGIIPGANKLKNTPVFILMQ